MTEGFLLYNKKVNLYFFEGELDCEICGTRIEEENPVRIIKYGRDDFYFTCLDTECIEKVEKFKFFAKTEEVYKALVTDKAPKGSHLVVLNRHPELVVVKNLHPQDAATSPDMECRTIDRTQISHDPLQSRQIDAKEIKQIGRRS